MIYPMSILWMTDYESPLQCPAAMSNTHSVFPGLFLKPAVVASVAERKELTERVSSCTIAARKAPAEGQGLRDGEREEWRTKWAWLHQLNAGSRYITLYLLMLGRLLGNCNFLMMNRASW